MRTQRSLDVHRIRSTSDGLFYSAGIPSAHWNTKPGTYRFRAFKIAESVPIISAEVQEEFAAKLLTDPTMFAAPALVYVCVTTHEALGQGFVYDVLKHALAHPYRIQVDNAAMEPEYDPDIPVVALMNVTASSTVDRRQRVRDWIHAYDANFRMVCAVGDPEAVATHLDIQPTMAFFVNATAVVRT